MKYNTLLIYGILALALGSAAESAPGKTEAKAGAGSPGIARDLSEREASDVLDMVFRGRPRRALAYLDSLEARSGGEPLYLILRARCYQEFIPMDDADKSTGRVLSRPPLEELDRCIDACSRRLESANAPAELYFYRGWAWMAKAYVRSMTRDLYTAGKDAKQGKKDLERYLQQNPNDPTATGMLGAFLYFADTIPGAFKFLSKLLLLPTGDRSKGLEYLERASRGGGLLETDWKLILYNVYFYFEGRYEEGLAGLQRMIDLHPEYARTAIPLAVSRPYAPGQTIRNDEFVELSVSRIYGAPPREADWNALYLLQLLRAYGDRYCNHTSATAARLQSLIHESPRHPDWLAGYARLELGRLYASRGMRDDAEAMFQSVARGYSFDFLRKEAETLLKDLDRFAARFEDERLPDMDQWVAALYLGDADSLGVLRSRFAEIAPRSLAATFYLGECDLLAGDFESARERFNDVITVQAPAWEHAYQMIASTRIAEIYAHGGYYKTAARYQAVALSYYHNEYLVDWVLEGRKRFFERLSEGKEAGPPTLLAMCAARATALPHGGSSSITRVEDE